MPKGQQKSNREQKKPKADKPKKASAAPSTKGVGAGAKAGKK